MDTQTIREMRSNGKSYNEIARAIGDGRDNVRNYCLRAGLGGRRAAGTPPLTNDEVSARVAQSGNNVTYVSGYTTNIGTIMVKCNECGKVFKRTYKEVILHQRIRCPGCADRRRRRKEEVESLNAEKASERSALAEDRKIRKLCERESKRRDATCPVCGGTFVTYNSRDVYCSPECRRKARNRNRDSRIPREKVIDKDITLEGLHRRDNGVCYLCGSKCNYEDYTVVLGTTICGDWYPSIDHVVPIAKGGEHSWANIKLAHRRCNTLKSDSIPP